MMPMSLKRTATVAWSPALPHIPGFPQYLATASVAGALDASFSSQSELELFLLPTSTSHASADLVKVGGVVSSARFNRIAWSGTSITPASNGIIAGGLENGELSLYDPHKLLNPAESHSKDVLFNSQSHSSAVRGLDFNPIQSHLLGTGAGEGEILIWDLNNPTTPYSPGATKTPRLVGSEINVLSWNRCVPHILATSSSNGVTVVWDLKNRREVFSLNAPSSSSNSVWNVQGGNSTGAASSNRRQGVVVAWHPDVPLQLVTALEDDANPAIYLWDLRNAHAPLRALSGHSKGILSIAWCPKDSDLLLSCGKDNRTLCWNPTAGEMLGELPHADNWCFDVQWCCRNPNWISVASFDGTVSVQPLLPSETAVSSPINNTTDKDNPFDTIATSRPSHSTISLRQPPKWLRRPCSAAFAWGNRLVHVTASNHGVRVRTISSPPALKAQEFIAAIKSGTLSDLAKSRALSAQGDQPTIKSTWLVLHAHFDGPSGRKLLVDHLNLAIKANPVSSTHVPVEAAPITGGSDTDLIVSVIHGDYKSAVATAVAQNRFADALVLAACDGHDLYVQTRDAYLQSNTSLFASILTCATHGEWASVVQNAALDWRLAMIALLTYTQSDELTTQVSDLGDRISATREVHDKDLGVLMCNLLSGKIDTIVNEWVTNLHSAHLASPVQQQPMRWGQKCLERAQMMHELVEQSTVFLHALHGVKAPDHVSPSLQKILAEYASAMAMHGATLVAWNFLAMVPENAQQDVAILKDRVYHALSKADQPSTVPVCPYEVVALATLSAPKVSAPAVVSNPNAAHSTAPSAPYNPNPGNGYGYSNQASYAPQQYSSYQAPAYGNTPNAYQHQSPPSMVSNQGPAMGSNFVPPTGLAASMTPMAHTLPQPAFTPAAAPPKQQQGGWNDAPPMAPQAVVPRPVVHSNVPSPTASSFASGPLSNSNPQQQQQYPPQQQYPANQQQQYPANQQQQYSGNPSQQQQYPANQQQQYPMQPAKVSNAPLPPLPMTASAPPANNAFNPQGGNPVQQQPGPMQPITTNQVPQGMPPNNPYAGYKPASPINAVPTNNNTVPQGMPPNNTNQYAPYNNAPAPSAPQAAAASATAKSFPPGDRSHIVPEHKPLADSLMAAQAHVKQVHSATAQKRVAEDVDRRLNQLLDCVNNGTLDAGIISSLQMFTSAIDARDWGSASRVHQELATSSFDPWMLGLKRLIDLLSRS